MYPAILASLALALAPPAPGPSDTIATNAPSLRAGSEATARAIMADPASVNPIAFIEVVQYLWARGDRQQATFWYYLWQARTRPWVSVQGGAAGQARGAMSETIGRSINEWAASDYDAWIALTRRAITFERTMPLSPDRPQGVTEEQWLEAVARERNSYAGSFEELVVDPRFSKSNFEAQRRANGLYVGEWRQPGAELPESWR